MGFDQVQAGQVRVLGLGSHLVPVSSSSVMERSASQYDSFLFWRQPIPELDPSELEDLLEAQPARGAAGRDRSGSARRQQEEEEVSEAARYRCHHHGSKHVAVATAEGRLFLLCGGGDVFSSNLTPGCRFCPPTPLQDLLSEFSSFTFWRAPLADVDSLLADLNLLL